MSIQAKSGQSNRGGVFGASERDGAGGDNTDEWARAVEPGIAGIRRVVIEGIDDRRHE